MKLDDLAFIKPKRINNDISADDIALMQELRNDGMTIALIAEKFDCSGSFVWRHTKPSPINTIKIWTLQDKLRKGIPVEDGAIIIANGKPVGIYRKGDF